MTTNGFRTVTMPADHERLEALLGVPKAARGLVLFSHGSGSARRSPHNQACAAALNSAGFATLLFDLLTPHEAATRGLVLDVPFLAARLEAITRWSRFHPELADLPVAYCGSSAGTAVALVAAASLGRDVSAVISRGGRPELAGEAVGAVTAPTLFIVGEDDSEIILHTMEAMQRMDCTRQLVMVPGATHLFPEPGAMDRVHRLAVAWLRRYVDTLVFADKHPAMAAG